MLAERQELDAEELIDRAWAVVESFVSLDGPEREYIEAIHRGELRTELLVPHDPELAARLSRHPAILWKLQNVRRHLET